MIKQGLSLILPQQPMKLTISIKIPQKTTNIGTEPAIFCVKLTHSRYLRDIIDPVLIRTIPQMKNTIFRNWMEILSA